MVYIKKYELTGKPINGLYRIVRLSDGKIGGWVSNNRNLSHFGNCWIDDDARVIGHARISGDAKILENACISDSAIIYENAVVRDNAKISNYATVCDTAVVTDNAHVKDYAVITDLAHIGGDAIVSGTVKIGGSVHVINTAHIAGNATIWNCKTIIKSNDDWWSSDTGEDIMTWSKDGDHLRIGCRCYTVEQWWQITKTSIATKYPKVTAIFRERFSTQKPEDFYE